MWYQTLKNHFLTCYKFYWIGVKWSFGWISILHLRFYSSVQVRKKHLSWGWSAYFFQYSRRNMSTQRYILFFESQIFHEKSTSVRAEVPNSFSKIWHNMSTQRYKLFFESQIFHEKRTSSRAEVPDSFNIGHNTLVQSVQTISNLSITWLQGDSGKEAGMWRTE